VPRVKVASFDLHQDQSFFPQLDCFLQKPIASCLVLLLVAASTRSVCPDGCKSKHTQTLCALKLPPEVAQNPKQRGEVRSYANF